MEKTIPVETRRANPIRDGSVTCNSPDADHGAEKEIAIKEPTSVMDRFVRGGYINTPREDKELKHPSERKSSNSQGTKQDYQARNCPCGGVCLVFTGSNTGSQPGRSFYKCNGCRYLQWCDALNNQRFLDTSPTKAVHDSEEEDDLSGSGTVVIRSPRSSQSSSIFRDPSSGSTSRYTSFDGASTSGTLVVKVNKRREQATDNSDYSRNSRDHTDQQKPLVRSQQVSDEEDDSSLSASLSLLLLPSLKEALGGDDSKGSVGHRVSRSLVKMERKKPGSCEAFVAKLIEQLGSTKEVSVKELQDIAMCVFGKTMNNDAENKRKQASKEFTSNTNVSPLGRFLFSRWLGQTSRDLNPS